MSIPSTTKDAALNGITVTAMSLHTDWPGVTGANEVTGGSPAYARKAATPNASAGGQRVTPAAITFDVPACTVRWIGLWNSGTFVGAMANGGATPKNFIAMPSTEKIAATAHGFTDGTKVAFFNGTPPTGLTEGTLYVTRDGSPDAFAVTQVLGNPPVNITSGSSFGCVLCAVTEKVYTSQDTHQVTQISMAVPD